MTQSHILPAQVEGELTFNQATLLCMSCMPGFSVAFPRDRHWRDLPFWRSIWSTSIKVPPSIHLWVNSCIIGSRHIGWIEWDMAHGFRKYTFQQQFQKQWFSTKVVEQLALLYCWCMIWIWGQILLAVGDNDAAKEEAYGGPRSSTNSHIPNRLLLLCYYIFIVKDFSYIS